MGETRVVIVGDDLPADLLEKVDVVVAYFAPRLGDFLADLPEIRIAYPPPAPPWQNAQPYLKRKKGRR